MFFMLMVLNFNHEDLFAKLPSQTLHQAVGCFLEGPN